MAVTYTPVTDWVIAAQATNTGSNKWLGAAARIVKASDSTDTSFHLYGEYSFYQWYSVSSSGEIVYKYLAGVDSSMFNTSTPHETFNLAASGLPAIRGTIRRVELGTYANSVNVTTPGFQCCWNGTTYSNAAIASYTTPAAPTTDQNVNKVVIGDETLIDISSDTVTEAVLLSGYTAHDRNGASIVGEYVDQDTTYSAGTGLSLSGTTFNHSNSVTAGTAGTSSDTSGVTLAVPYITYDAQGHITAAGTHTHTGAQNLSWYGTCSTAAGTAAKVVNCSGFVLATGATITVYASADNTVQGAITLNVNSTGAKTVRKQNAATSATNTLPWWNGDVLQFTYDGTYWQFVSNTGASYASRTRPTSANFSKDGGGSMRHLLATSTMTTGKPEADGHIIDMAWDNSDDYNSQFYLSNDMGEAPSWRAQTKNATAWDKFYTHAFPPSVQTRRLFAATDTTPYQTTVGGGVYVDTGVYQDFSKDFTVRVDFTPPTTAGRCLLLGAYSYYPGIGIELSATNYVRLYCMSDTGQITDKPSLALVTAGVPATVVYRYEKATATVYWYVDNGTAKTTGSFTLTGTYSQTCAYSLRMGTDYRGNPASTFAVTYPITVAPPVYTAEETSGAYVCTWDETSLDGVVTDVTEVLAASLQSGGTSVVAGTGLTFSGDTLNHSNAVTAGTIGTSSATSGSTIAVPYATYDAQGHITGKGTHTHTVNSLPASAISSGTISTSRLPSNILYQPTWTVRNYDIFSLPLVNTLRGNRLALLPADQIIIEQTTDGGTTWTDAGITDAVKRQLFVGTSATTSVSIPLLNGYQDKNCGVRITITAMKYNVPDNTAETAKYNYWNSNYVLSQERYCSLTNLYCWVNTNGNNAIALKIEYATGAASTTWNTVKNFSDGQTLTGYSGGDVIYGLGNKTFGGSKTQTGNNWNWRLTFMTEANVYGEALVSRTAAQTVMRIQGYGASAWGVPNNLVGIDHLYTWDYDQNASFPAMINGGNISCYGYCSTAAATAAKVVSASSAFKLVAGTLVHVRFTQGTTVSGKITLNVGSTGAKDVYVNQQVTSASNALHLFANSYASFQYDGSYWQLVSCPTVLYSTPNNQSPNDFLNGSNNLEIVKTTTSMTGSPTDANGWVFNVGWASANNNGQFFLPNRNTGAPKWRAQGGTAWTSSMAWDSFYTHLFPPAFSNITGTAASSQLPAATSSAIGAVKPDGQSVIVSSDGTITATPAAVGMTCTERSGGVSLDTYDLETNSTAWPSDGGWGWREEVWNDGRMTLYWWKWFATTGSGWQQLWTNLPYPTDATAFVDTPNTQVSLFDNAASVQGAAMIKPTTLRTANNTTGFKMTYYNSAASSSAKTLVLFRADGHWWKEGGSDPDDPTPAEEWAIGDAISIGGVSYYPVTEWTVSSSGAGGDSRLKAAVRFLITTTSTTGAWHVYAQYSAWTDTGYVPTSSQNGYMLIRKLNSSITTYTNDAGTKAKGDVWSTLNTNQRQGYVYNGVVSGNLIWGDTPYIITDCGTVGNGVTVTSKTFYVGTTETSGGVYTQTSVSASTTTPSS